MCLLSMHTHHPTVWKTIQHPTAARPHVITTTIFCWLPWQPDTYAAAAYCAVTLPVSLIFLIVGENPLQWPLCVCVSYLGLSSGGTLLKLTTGICRVVGRECSEGARKGLGGRRGERSGELSPLLRRNGERWARDTEFCSSSPSSSSRMDGSFFTKPPLLSQSTWEEENMIKLLI